MGEAALAIFDLNNLRAMKEKEEREEKEKAEAKIIKNLHHSNPSLEEEEVKRQGSK